MKNAGTHQYVDHFMGPQAHKAFSITRSSDAWREAERALRQDGFRVVPGAFIAGEVSPGVYDVLTGFRGRGGAEAVVHVFVDVDNRSVTRVVTARVSGPDEKGNRNVLVDDGATRTTAVVSGTGQELSKTVEHYEMSAMLTPSQQCSLGMGFVAAWQCYVVGKINAEAGLVCSVVWTVVITYIC